MRNINAVRGIAANRLRGKNRPIPAFYAIGNSVSPNTLGKSIDDGKTWTERTYANGITAFNNRGSLASKPDGSVMVSMPPSNGNNVLSYTLDQGQSWSNGITMTQTLAKLEWNKEAARFIIQATTGGSPQANDWRWSEDGINWTSITPPTGPSGTPLQFSGIAYGGGKLMAFWGGTGQSQNVAYSTDWGATWTYPAGGNFFGTGQGPRNMVWSPELGIWSAVRGAGTQPTVGWSTDGITWSTTNNTFDAQNGFMVWSHVLQAFVRWTGKANDTLAYLSTDGKTYTTFTFNEVHNFTDIEESNDTVIFFDSIATIALMKADKSYTLVTTPHNYRLACYNAPT